MTDVIKLEKIITKTTLIAIMIVGSILIVTARAEHIPKTCIVIGLSSLNGSDIIFFLLFDKSGSDIFSFLIFLSKTSVLIKLIFRNLNRLI